jgi:hypothetical protein
MTSRFVQSLGPAPIVDAPAGSRSSNWFEEGHGGAPGRGKVLIRASDWPAVRDDPELRLVITELDDGGDGLRGVSIPVVAHAAAPFTSPRTQGMEWESGIVEVTLADGRLGSLNGHFSKYYNVQEQGFPHDGSSFSFYASTLDGGVPWTWEDVLADLGASVVPASLMPTVAPRNVILSNVSKSAAVDYLERLLCKIASFNGSAFVLHVRGTPTALNETIYQDMRKREIRSSLARFSDRRWPEEVAFKFRIDSPASDPFGAAERWHEEIRSTGFGPGFRKAFNVGHWIAKKVGSTIVNAAELDSVADYYAAANPLDAHEEAGEFVASGIYPMSVDGKFRRVLWEFGRDGYRTRVKINDESPFRIGGEETRRRVEFLGDGLATESASGDVLLHAKTSDARGAVLVRLTPSGSSVPYSYAVVENDMDEDGNTSDLTPAGDGFNLYEKSPYGHGQSLTFALGTLTVGPVQGVVIAVRTRPGVYAFDVPNPMTPACLEEP